MFRCYVGLGANLGEPARQVEQAIAAIADLPGVSLLRRSSLYRSAPMGGAAQPDYCNAAVVLDSRPAPNALLDALLAIERAAGRRRDGRRWGSRELDLDLLHVEGLRSAAPGLRLPHPGIARRNFVLVPLAEAAPDLEIPGLGRVADLAAAAGWRDLEIWARPAAPPFQERPHMTEPLSEARLRWLCRRGMKELDVIVTRYHERRYPGASAEERAAFVRLLSEVEDPDIWAWVMGYLPPAPEYAHVIEQLRGHH